MFLNLTGSTKLFMNGSTSEILVYNIISIKCVQTLKLSYRPKLLSHIAYTTLDPAFLVEKVSNTLIELIFKER